MLLGVVNYKSKSFIHKSHRRINIRLCQKTTKCLIEICWHPKKVLLRLKMNWEKEKNNWSTFWYSSAGLKIWTPINKSRKINFIGGHTLLNKKCRKFYILGGEFFLFWRNRKNVASRAKKPCFGRKMTGNGRKWLKNMVFPLWKPHFCDFIKIKKIRSLICKISDIFCFAKYDAPIKLIFWLLLYGCPNF